MKNIGIFLLSAITIAMYSFDSSEPLTRNIFDFNSSSDAVDWKIVNDDVMGGISTSKFTITSDGTGLFKGKVSTENYGGFASVRFSSEPVNVNDMKSIKIRLKGDGKEYQFRIKHNETDYYSYVQTFSTNGKWQSVKLKLNEFYPSFRGRKLNMRNFNKTSIEQFSILIANKKDETFEIELDRIDLISDL